MPTDSNIISFTTDDALLNLEKEIRYIDKLLELGAKIHDNEEQLEVVLKLLRKYEIVSQFYTMDEVAEALHCEKKSAINGLRNRGVELVSQGKVFVVQKDNFLNAFRNA